MSNPFVSILIPGIRTPNWGMVLDTLAESCKRFSYEVIFAGPFSPPKEAIRPNVTFVPTWRCPSAAAQEGALHCRGKLILHNVDDAKFVPNAVDEAVDQWVNAQYRRNIVNCRYTEDDDYRVNTFPMDFWWAHYHPPLRLPGVPSSYKISLHFLMDYGYFCELGGFDCAWEYQNFNLHDLMYRAQYNGATLSDSITDVTNCNHYGKRAVDHGPIEDAYVPDSDLYRRKYSDPNALNPNTIHININNWQLTPEVWARRFHRKFSSYEEMICQ